MPPMAKTLESQYEAGVLDTRSSAIVARFLNVGSQLINVLFD